MSIWTPEFLAKVVGEYERGDGPTLIGARYGLTRATVTAKLQREGFARTRASRPSEGRPKAGAAAKPAAAKSSLKSPPVKRVMNPLGHASRETAARLMAAPKTVPRDQARAFGETRVPPAVVFGPIPPTGPKPPFHGKAAAFAPLPGSHPKVWTERGSRQCAWVVGGEGSEVLSCCDPVFVGSWCAEHHRIGHQRVAPGQPRTANELARSLRRYA